MKLIVLFFASALGVLSSAAACLAQESPAPTQSAGTVKDLGGKLQDWGYSESVLADGNNVVRTPGGSKGTMAAFDKMTGKVLWQSIDLSNAAQYSLPFLVESGGQPRSSSMAASTFGIRI